MSFITKVRTVIRTPSAIPLKLLSKPIAKCLPDKSVLKWQYKLLLGKRLNLKNPQDFNEKIQWLKLYNRNPLYVSYVDKYEAKRIISDWVGREYAIPTIGGPWKCVDEIDFSKLPNQFVLKCTHDSAGLVICRDKSKLDIEKAKKKIASCLQSNFYWRFREWVYKDIEPRIIAEQYMEDENATVVDGKKTLTDYKFFTFNGEAKFIYISECLESHDSAHISFFDLNGKRMPFKRLDYNGFDHDPKMPDVMNELTDITNTLAKKVNAPFLRVDLYVVNGKIYFSELTFYPHAGFIPFDPPEYDKILGNYIDIGKQ